MPVTMPFLLVLWLRERLTRAEVLGTFCAFAGGLVLAFSDYRYSPEHLPGDGICLASMLCLTVYLVLARRNRTFHSIWLYTVPLYAAGGVLCLVLSAPLEASRWAWPDGRDWLMLLGLTLVPTVIGHTLLANAMRQFPGQTVALFNLGQFVFAGAMAVPIFHEMPHASFYLSSGLIVAGATASILWKHKSTPAPSAEAIEREAETAAVADSPSSKT
jgi:drug/metabolite transporter (DMT)-like permease